MDTNAKLYQDMTKILVKREDIQKAVAQLGREITRDYQGRDLVMVCILKGASVFFSDLIREVDLPVTLDFMALSSYRNSTKSSGVVNLEKDLSVSIKGRDVLIVEDIVDSGNTLFYLGKYLMGRGASSIRIATLLDKPDRRNPEHNLTVDYHCFKIPDESSSATGWISPRSTAICRTSACWTAACTARRTNKSADSSPNKDKIFVKMDFSAHVIRLYGYTPQQADGAGTEGGCSH